MKKTIILIVIMLSIAGAVFSQTTMYCYKVLQGNWNVYAKTWIWDEPRYLDNMEIVVSKTHIYFSDKAHSSYRVFQDLGDKEGVANNGESYTSHSWKCYDEKERVVVFGMTLYSKTNDKVYSVMYNDVCYLYYVNPIGLSNLKND